MESKWRANVADFGLVGLPIGLTSRFLDADPRYALTNWITVPGLAQVAFFDADVQVPITFTAYPIPLVNPRFPYGYEVEPDD